MYRWSLNPKNPLNPRLLTPAATVFTPYVFLFQGCLVKTGKYYDGDEDQLTPLKPDHIHQSITEAIKTFIG